MVKVNLPANAGDVSSIPRLGRSPGEGNGNPLQYSCQENLMDRGAWRATVHAIARVGHILATTPPPPSTPVFSGFPCGSAGKKFACNARDLGSILWVGKIPWRREWLPTPVFWPGEFHGLYSPRGNKEADTTEQLSLSLHIFG